MYVVTNIMSDPGGDRQLMAGTSIYLYINIYLLFAGLSIVGMNLYGCCDVNCVCMFVNCS